MAFPNTASGVGGMVAQGVSISERHSAAQPLWPSQRRLLDLPSARTAYVDSGQGFPVVMIHGLMGYSFSWRKNIPELEKYFRAMALDLAGCGHSGPLKSGRYGLEAWSRQLEEFLDAMGVAKAHLVGTSAGGAVALEFAARCAHRVARIALAAPVTPFSRRARFLARLYSISGLPLPLLRSLLARAPQLLPWLFRHRYYTDPARITPETVPGYLEGFGPAIVPVLRQAIMDWEPSRVLPTLSSIHAPVLLIWGREDNIVPPECMPQLLKSLSNATAVTIPGTGHFCYEEKAAEFNAALLKFFPIASETP